MSERDKLIRRIRLWQTKLRKFYLHYQCQGCKEEKSRILQKLSGLEAEFTKLEKEGPRWIGKKG